MEDKTMTMIKTNESGRSMIEMLGVLAIIGVLSVGGIAGYSKAMEKFKFNKAIDEYSTLLFGVVQHLDDFKHIQIKDCVYTKTSPISYILSKYFSDRNSREVLNLGLADLHKEIEGLVNGEEKE